MSNERGRIVFHSKENPVYEIEIDDYTYSFSVAYVPEEKREWFVNVVSNHFNHLHERTQRNTVKETRQFIRAAIGLE